VELRDEVECEIHDCTGQTTLTDI